MAESDSAKVLLLGLLWGQDMHGYQMTDIIEKHFGVSTELTRPTAYRLLGQMAAEGWIEDHQEQAGNRPPRRVFHLTEAGRAAFLGMLRKVIATYRPAEYLAEHCIAFVDAVPATEAVRLLETRREKIEAFIKEVSDDAGHHGAATLLLLHRRLHLQTELEWTDLVIASMNESSG